MKTMHEFQLVKATKICVCAKHQKSKFHTFRTTAPNLSTFFYLSLCTENNLSTFFHLSLCTEGIFLSHPFCTKG